MTESEHNKTSGTREHNKKADTREHNKKADTQEHNKKADTQEHNKKNDARRRLFDIITIGNRDDLPSRSFDVILVITIFLNVIVTFMQTFEELSALSDVFNVIEIVTVTLFCIEYLLRIFTADFLYPGVSKGGAVVKFLLSFDGIVDLLTILPLVPLYGLIAFRILRVVRIFHLFRINATLDSFNIIALVIKDKWKQIVSSLIIILIFMLASSLGIYSVEHEAQPAAFPNAFSGIWWSVSALLTVGYGDIYPITVAGKIMGIIIAFLGVGLVAIPTGIISAGFVEQYSFRTMSEKPISDINDIGEVLIDGEHPACGKTVAEISKSKTLMVLLIIRDELRLIPTDNLRIKEGDILVLESERTHKSRKGRNFKI